MNFLIDTHVHIHQNFSQKTCFDNAFRNFERMRSENFIVGTKCQYVLCLTERPSENFFNRLKNAPHQQLTFPYKVRSLENDPLTLVVQAPDSSEILLVNGKQFISQEGLEVLALCSGLDFAAPLNLSTLLSEVLAHGGVPVIPWSPGKWFFKRGLLVLQQSLTRQPNTFLLGDTAMRPRWFPLSPLCCLAKINSIKTIAGSDPLPLAEEESQIASYLSYFPDCSESGEIPSLRISQLLLGQSKQIRLGKRNSLPQAVARWLNLRRNKHSNS